MGKGYDKLNKQTITSFNKMKINQIQLIQIKWNCVDLMMSPVYK